MNKLAFTGTRQGCSLKQLTALQALLDTLPVREFHHGNCIGADTQAHDLMVMRSQIHIWPSDMPRTQSDCIGDKHYPPKAPLERNKDIVDGAQLLVACPNGMYVEQRSGTWAAVRYALKIGVPVTVVWPDGTAEPNFKLTEENHGA